jgi:hypothetical protein
MKSTKLVQTMLNTPKPTMNLIQPTNEDTFSIQWGVIYGGYFSIITITIFLLLLSLVFPNEPNGGKMYYVSEGLLYHCGWAVLVLGMGTTVILGIQAINALHLKSKYNFVFLGMEIFGWFVVLGVESTGWIFHYIGLCLFVIGNIAFHWNSSRDATYGNSYYQTINYLTILFAALFLIANRISDAYQDSHSAKSTAVSLELFLVCLMGIQQCFLNYGFSKFEKIHLYFEQRQSANV